MTLARSLTALLVAAIIGGCASIGTGSTPVARAAELGGSDDDIRLLELAEYVDAAGRASAHADP